MLRKKINFNNLFSEFDSLFEDFGSFSSPYLIRGKKNVESGNDENGSWTKESFVSEDGSYQVTTIYKTSSETNKPSSETLDLKKQLESAVEKQDYESAAKLRDKIKSIESNKEKIKELESKLNDSVKNQDFESAIKYRDEIKKLKS
jgi:protein-arginine kinase activator protein McsA